MSQEFIVPTFTEIEMSAEIGSYQEDFEPPAERDFAAPKAEARGDAETVRADG